MDANGDPLDDPVTGNPLADVSDTSDTGTDGTGAGITDPDTVESPNPLGEFTNSGTDLTDDPTTLLIAPDPSIEIIKSAGVVTDVNGNGFTDAGDTIAYTFSVENTGNVTLANVGVTDALLDGANGTLSGGPIATLAPGAVDSATVYRHVHDSASGC